MEQIVSSLQNEYPSIGAVTVYDWQKNQIYFQSEAWDISEDLGTILTAWQESKPSIMVQGIKYSTLQCTPERLVCRNLQGQGAIVGANYNNQLIMIAWVSADGDPGNAYRAVTKSMDEIRQAGY
ncbi:MAG: hypothetical protein GF329_10715 [Candidatus Lokiarchaeota archaeon]|nr:hypothetical protein [Candidatus Lokiarchaeota archaeon]